MLLQYRLLLHYRYYYLLGFNNSVYMLHTDLEVWLTCSHAQDQAAAVQMMTQWLFDTAL